jgi:hypothetical protein
MPAPAIKIVLAIANHSQCEDLSDLVFFLGSRVVPTKTRRLGAVSSD